MNSSFRILNLKCSQFGYLFNLNYICFRPAYLDSFTEDCYLESVIALRCYGEI
jgi:hypothetical protein